MSQGFSEGQDVKVEKNIGAELAGLVERHSKLEAMKLKEVSKNNPDKTIISTIDERITMAELMIAELKAKIGEATPPEKQEEHPSSTIEAIEGELGSDMQSAIEDVTALLNGTPTRDELVSAFNLIQTHYGAAENNPNVADASTFLRLDNLMKELNRRLKPTIAEKLEWQGNINEANKETKEYRPPVDDGSENGPWARTGMATSDRRSKRDNSNTSEIKTIKDKDGRWQRL